MSSFLSIVSVMLSGAWSLLVSCTYPGTGLSFASILIGSACAVISLRYIGSLIGVSFNSGSISRASNNIKVVAKRSKDQIHY